MLFGAAIETRHRGLNAFAQNHKHTIGGSLDIDFQLVEFALAEVIQNVVRWINAPGRAANADSQPRKILRSQVLLDRFDELVADSGVARVTGRERSVLEGLAAGEDLTAIGEDRQMLISEVQNHVANVLGRLRAGAPVDLGPEAREVVVAAAG